MQFDDTRIVSGSSDKTIKVSQLSCTSQGSGDILVSQSFLGDMDVLNFSH